MFLMRMHFSDHGMAQTMHFSYHGNISYPMRTSSGSVQLALVCFYAFATEVSAAYTEALVLEPVVPTLEQEPSVRCTLPFFASNDSRRRGHRQTEPVLGGTLSDETRDLCKVLRGKGASAECFGVLSTTQAPRDVCLQGDEPRPPGRHSRSFLTRHSRPAQQCCSICAMAPTSSVELA